MKQKEQAPDDRKNHRTETMRLAQNSSQLLIIDPQTRLVPAIKSPHDYLQRILQLVKISGALNIPTWATEHCADKIGPLCPEVSSFLEPGQILSKRTFGALDEPHISERLTETERNQFVICGVEAHVCVMQTALGLLRAGCEVFLAADACGSRFPEDRELAFRRLEQAGAVLTSVESVAFEWIGSGDHPAFRSILSLLKERG